MYTSGTRDLVVGSQSANIQVEPLILKEKVVCRHER